MLKRYFILVFITTILIFGNEPCKSQQVFSKTYGHFDFNYGKDVINIGTGFYVMGNSGINNGNSVPMLIHIDSIGHILKTGFGASDGVMSASKFAQKDDKLYVCGNIQNTATNDYDCFLSIYDTSLVLEKTVVYGGSSWDFSQCIIIQDTLVFVGGNTYSTSNGFSSGTITKFNLNGDSLSTYYFGVDGEAAINSFIVRGDTELLFTGSYQAPDSLFSAAFIASMSYNGTLNWFKNLSSELGPSVGNDIAESTLGHIAVCGTSEKYDTVSMKDGFAYVLGSDNNYYRHEIYNFNSLLDEEFKSITPTAEGDFYIGATTKSYGAGGTDLYFFKINFGAWWLWSNSFGGSGNEDVSKILYQPSDSGFILCGTSRSFGNFNENILVVKTTNKDTLDLNPTHELVVQNYAEQLNINAFPNPTRDKITFAGEQTVFIKYVEILDISGRTLGLIPKENLTDNTLDLSAFASQLLFVKVAMAKGTQMLKVIKQ
jgi:hypothetical protein